MSRASDKRELLRLAAHLRTDDGAFFAFPGNRDLSLWADATFADWMGSSDPWEQTAKDLESLAYEEPPRNGYVDDVKFALPEWPRDFEITAEYRRGFAAGVASTNTERAELRAQVEALTARLRALTPKKGRKR